MRFDNPYKDSKQKEFRELPESWTVNRIKDIAAINKKSLSENTNKDYCFSYVDIGNVNQQGLINEPEEITFINAPSRARRIICKNDIIISTVRTYLKAIAYFDYITKDYIASTGFAVLSPFHNNSAKYISYFLQSDWFVLSVIRNSTGISYPAINTSILSSLQVILPPKTEQNQIANFLDHKTTAIDKKISLLEQKITYYQEFRRSLINETVCRGLDKNVKLKDSSVEWIGKIPLNWTITRLGEIFKERSEKVSDKEYPPLSVTMQGIVPQLSNAAKTKNGDNRKKVVVNDFVINSRSDRKGSSGVSNYVGSVSVISIVLKPSKIVFPEYYHFAFKSYSFTEEFYKNGKGIVDDLWSTKYNVMRNIEIQLPPFEEQVSIAEFLKTKTTKIDQITTNIQNQIEALKELRKTLINDVVTGKIKVTENHE